MVVSEPSRAMRGVTLVELAIVLVVLAVVTGGVLAAREMITSARIEESLQILSDTRTALTNYELRYGALPHNDPGVARFDGVASDDTILAEIAQHRTAPAREVVLALGLLPEFGDDGGNNGGDDSGNGGDTGDGGGDKDSSGDSGGSGGDGSSGDDEANGDGDAIGRADRVFKVLAQADLVTFGDRPRPNFPLGSSVQITNVSGERLDGLSLCYMRPEGSFVTALKERETTAAPDGSAFDRMADAGICASLT